MVALSGFERCSCLTDIAVSGNPISDFADLKYLENLTQLTSLSLSDIHFGQCPVATLKGYKEFVLCFLKQVKVLDGVTVTKNDQLNATNAYNAQVNRL